MFIFSPLRLILAVTVDHHDRPPPRSDHEDTDAVTTMSASLYGWLMHSLRPLCYSVNCSAIVNSVLEMPRISSGSTFAHNYS